MYQWGAQSGYRTDIAGGDGGYIKVGYRYYDPTIGRFSSRDSDLTQFAYVYCGGDPVNATDSTGHSFGEGLMIFLAAAALAVAAYAVQVAIIAAGAAGLTFTLSLGGALLIGVVLTAVVIGVLYGAYEMGKSLADGMSGHSDDTAGGSRSSPGGVIGGGSPGTVPLYTLDPSNGEYYKTGSTDNPSAYGTMPPGSQIEDPPEAHPK